MTGWRIGYTVASAKITEVMYKLYVHTITGLSPFIQNATLEVFHCEEEIEKMRTIYESYGEQQYPCVRFSFASDMEMLTTVIKKIGGV